MYLYIYKGIGWEISTYNGGEHFRLFTVSDESRSATVDAGLGRLGRADDGVGRRMREKLRERENCSICSFVTFALCRTDKRNYTVRPEWYIPLHFHTRHTFSLPISTPSDTLRSFTLSLSLSISINSSRSLSLYYYCTSSFSTPYAQTANSRTILSSLGFYCKQYSTFILSPRYIFRIPIFDFFQPCKYKIIMHPYKFENFY